MFQTVAFQKDFFLSSAKSRRGNTGKDPRRKNILIQWFYQFAAGEGTLPALPNADQPQRGSPKGFATGMDYSNVPPVRVQRVRINNFSDHYQLSAPLKRKLFSLIVYRKQLSIIDSDGFEKK